MTGTQRSVNMEVPKRAEYLVRRALPANDGAFHIVIHRDSPTFRVYRVGQISGTNKAVYSSLCRRRSLRSFNCCSFIGSPYHCAASSQERSLVSSWHYGALMPKVTVEVDPSTCILAASCVGIEPKLFQIGSEAYVELIDPNGSAQGAKYTFEASETELQLIEEAIQACPTQAVSITPAT